MKSRTKYLSSSEEIEKLKADIQELINKGMSKNKAIEQIAEKYYCSVCTIWERIREVKVCQ